MFLAKFGSAHFCEALLLCGWSQPEQEWVWSEGKFSVLAVESVCCAACRISLLIEAPLALGQDAVFRISVNGVDHGERTLPPGFHEIVLDHEAPASSNSTGLVIAFFHETCRAPAETAGEDGRRINIGLKTLAIETLAPLRRDDIPRFQPGEPGDAYFVRREAEGFRRETHQKNEVLAAFDARGPGRTLEFFLYGLGGNRYDRQPLWRGLLGSPAAHGAGDLGAPEALQALVERIAPDFLPVLLQRHDGAGVESRVYAPETDNPLYDPVRRFPAGSAFGEVFQEKRLPAQSVLCARDADVLATPRQFLVFDPRTSAYYPLCNPTGLTQLSIDCEVAAIGGALVIAGDEYDDSNVSHFLFDCCLRIAQFCDLHPDLKATATFLMNGRPTALHELAVAALCDLHGLNARQIVFPRQPVRLRPAQGAYWFSDLGLHHHPCQRFRPEALARFTALARNMAGRVAPSPHRARKILISRSDASLRRLANEDALMDRLGPLGVQRVVMSRHSWAEQVDIVANADVIVGAHGMGLTMAAFNFRKGRMIEIFHPVMATTAYAIMAKAYGMDYLPVFGVETDAQKVDFAISAFDIDWISRLVAS
jgi:hypothetical protein